MKKLGKLFGIIGAILLLFGIVEFLIRMSFSTYNLIHIVGGLVLLLTYGISNAASLKTGIGSRTTKYGTNAAVYIIVFLAILVMVNFVLDRHSKRFDLTESKRFSISDQTVKVLGSLEEPVELLAFFQQGEGGPVEDLLKSYDHASGMISYAFVDPVRHPEKAKEHDISQTDVIVVSCGARETQVTEPTEEEITNGIIKISKRAEKKVYFLDGHGEHDIMSEEEQGYMVARKAIENENYASEKLLLGAQEKVPEDCAVLVVSAPQKPVLESELKMIDEFLKGGGKAIFMVEPRESKELAGFLKGWGMELGDDIIVDMVIRLFAGASLGIEPIVEDYGTHAITQEFQQRTIFPMVRSVSAAMEPAEGIEVIELATTSSSSWAEQDLDNLFENSEAKQDAEERVGPVPIAAVAEDSGKGTKIVVFGDAEFANNRYFNYYYNGDLFMNALNWLAGEEDLISIRPRMARASRVQLTADQTNLIFYLSVLIIPEILLIFGIGVWWRRR